MTIAACYFSSEGVVLGADSTTTMTSVLQRPGLPPYAAMRHFDYAQKIFEVGEHGTLGIAIWGAGRIGRMSHRTFFASVSDEWSGKQLNSVSDAAGFLANS